MKNTIAQTKFWVYSTAFIMSFNGGYINSISLASILKNAVGYVTGDLTIAGAAIEQKQYWLFAHLMLLVVFFLIGSVISGLVIKGQNFKLDRRYSLSLIFQAATVLSAMLLLVHGYDQAGYFLALTMGMQNAMTTHYGSALIRTTHMTGTTTDLGIIISRWIKGYDIEFWKLRLYIFLIVGFACGAIFGALIYSFIHVYGLLLSLCLYIVMIFLGLTQRHLAES